MKNVVVGWVLCSAYANVDKEGVHSNGYYKRQAMRSLPLKLGPAYANILH